MATPFNGLKLTNAGRLLSIMWSATTAVLFDNKVVTSPNGLKRA